MQSEKLSAQEVKLGPPIPFPVFSVSKSLNPHSTFKKIYTFFLPLKGIKYKMNGQSQNIQS